MTKLNPLLLCDFYKIGHIHQYPKGTEKIYSTWTPRGSRMDGVESCVFYGLQGFIKEYLQEYFDVYFFCRDIDDILIEYKETLKECLFIEDPDTSHIEALHKLGYLPLKIDALAEGTLVPMRVPMFTVENTLPEFFWLTNALETLISTEIWPGITVATIAHEYRRILDNYSLETTGSTEGVQFQAHDFSMRGMSSLSHGAKAGGGHLLSFQGSDCIPAIHYLKNYYNGNMTMGNIGCSIPATEHSVQCANMPDNEDETDIIKRLITEIYPSGLVSIVMDTNDFWKNVTEVLPSIKDIIMKREGKLVVRPDSGDPVNIICGIDIGEYSPTEHERKGLIEVLWDIFGGTTTKQGYKMLDEHIGAIYGDSITLDRADLICKRLKEKGFASLNIVFGVGSYGYNCVTRDTFCQAFKSTYAVINGEEKLLSKDPKTDSGTKKSQRGMVAVLPSQTKMKKDIFYIQNLDKERKSKIAPNDLLTTIFKDGKLLKECSLDDIKNTIKDN